MKFRWSKKYQTLGVKQMLLRIEFNSENHLVFLCIQSAKNFYPKLNSPTFLFKRKKKKIENVSNKQLRTNEATTSGLCRFYISFIHSQKYLNKVHKQDPPHLLCLFSYLHILVLQLLCGFVFIFRGLHRISTHSPSSATSHSYTTMQV